jgi:hypothetical protein
MRIFLNKLFRYGLYFIMAYLVIFPLWVKLLPKPFKKNMQFVESDVLFYSLDELDTLKHVDILFIGSSHVYRGIDPMIFTLKGIEVFGIGTSGQTHEQTEILLNRYLDQTNPKLVAYEVYPLLFSYDGTGSSISLLGTLDKGKDLLPLVYKSNSFKAVNSLYYALLSEYFPSLRNQKMINNKMENYLGAGFFKETQKPAYQLQPIDTFAWTFHDEQVDAFKRNIKYIQSKGIPVILYKAPITKHYESAALNNLVFDSLIQTATVPYIDFSLSSSLIDTVHFYDKDHMLQEGVKIFNQDLLDSLLLYLN